MELLHKRVPLYYIIGIEFKAQYSVVHNLFNVLLNYLKFILNLA